MPKVIGTRKLKALELLKTVTNGPATDLTFCHLDGLTLTKEQKEAIEKHYKDGYWLWSQSWIIPQLKVLIPELKEIKNV